MNFSKVAPIAGILFALAGCDNGTDPTESLNDTFGEKNKESSSSVIQSSSSAVKSSSSSSKQQDVSSSSSVKSSSSSSKPQDISSSSSVKSSSSSSKPQDISSSSQREKKVFETWYGDEGILQMNTGLDNGSNTSGYWMTYTDQDDNGKSSIKWYGEDNDGTATENVLDYCSGVCGTFTLDKGTLTYDPFVGIYFNVAGVDEDGKATAVDASDWDGICILYSLDIAASMELVPDAATEAELKFDLPAAALPRATTFGHRCFAWREFKQSGWGGVHATGEDIAKKLASIRIRMQAKSGTTGKFNIVAVGDYHHGGRLAGE